MESGCRQDPDSDTDSSHKQEKSRSDAQSSQEPRHQHDSRHDWKTSHCSNLSANKPFHKSAARKEYEEKYEKIVTNPFKYLQEWYHQINPEFYQAEVNAMRYFRAMTEDVTIQVLTLIDWAVEYLQMSSSPTLDIPVFLCSPFVAGGKPSQNPMPMDPGITHRWDIDVRTKAQWSWTYLCVLLQYWTNEATVAMGNFTEAREGWPTH